jgi:[acyl-carrier-protein] S-malonyltransferase
VLARIEACGLTAANINGAGQIVAGGTAAQLAAFAADPPPKARLRPLAVAGAFHTIHMAPAVDALREAAAGVTAASPALALLSDRDGSVVRSGPDWLERIIAQVAAPVRWDRCMQAMNSLGVSALVELPPAGTLTGLARRALPGVQTLALKGPGDLEKAWALLAAHDTDSDVHVPEWRLVVAPLAGTFRARQRPGAPPVPGTAVGTGTELGHVEMRGTSHAISPGFPATIIEWLVEDGDPVSVGQPLVRLEPAMTADAAGGRQ